MVLGAVRDESPLTALLSIPSGAWSRLPLIIQWAVYVLLALLQFVALFWFLSRGGVETYMPNEIQTRFTDVWGQDHVLDKVRENLVMLEQPEIVEKVGGYVPSGILLWGPPGTGKTLIAEAVAGETGKPYVFVDPGAFQAMFVGVGVMKVKALFRKLRKLALRYGGVVVFFDEADSLGNRGQLSQGGWRSSNDSLKINQPEQRENLMIDKVVVSPGGGGGGMGTLQALLAEMQGLKKPRGTVFRQIRKILGMRAKQPPKYRIMYIMATNMPDSLDQALLRPGRIDRIYKVGYPTKEGRRRTYEGYLSKVPHNLSEDQLEKLAAMTPPRTGAEIKDVVNEALINSMKNGRTCLEWQDLIHARYLRQTGLPEGFIYSDWERHAVAIHEACHAVAAVELQPWAPIDIATIERRGNIGGFVASFEDDEQFSHWNTDFEARICVSLASLAGEKMFFEGSNSAGVSGDLETATSIAYAMLGYLGMGETISSLAGRPESIAGDIQDKKSTSLDERVENKLREMYDKVESVLGKKRGEVLAVANALEIHKTITGEDVAAILNKVKGPKVDGSLYLDDKFMNALERYHSAAVKARKNHDQIDLELPQPENYIRSYNQLSSDDEVFSYGEKGIEAENNQESEMSSDNTTDHEADELAQSVENGSDTDSDGSTNTQEVGNASNEDVKKREKNPKPTWDNWLRENGENL
jgi:ATP-dependent Zn protease